MNRSNMGGHIGRALAGVGLFLCSANLLAQPPAEQAAPRSHPGRPLVLNQSRYRLRAGERTRVEALPETLDFIRTAKTISATINGSQTRGFAVGPSTQGDEVILAASLTMKEGEYAVTVSAVDQSGEQRTTEATITVDALPAVPSGGSTPPVVLLNGWQFSVIPPSSCPMAPNGSITTFGSLASKLIAPQVYFFDNCVEQSVNGSSIEQLGVTLGQYLNMVQYTDGSLVPQVDLVSHSMGGLIARSYLAGLQPNGSLSPLLNPRVRKFIEIATPNFGSFLAANYSDLLANGTQAAEMVPGSPFLWSLATWNQLGDDLRGVDALAVIGNAGYWKSSIFATQVNNLSDGVVSLTSASLNFARDPSRTRILTYCHIDSASAAGSFINCTGKGIADVDEAPETGQIILSFLAGTSTWQSVGFSNQTQYGGAYFALENAAGTQYTQFSSVLLGSVPFQSGRSNTFFYNEFVSGTGTFSATSTANQKTTCGPFTATGGYFSIFRCKFNPVIYSVGPLLTNAAGRIVASGASITINGVGFGSQCSGCQIVAYPGPVTLPVSSWSDAAITALLPSTFNGIAEVIVQAAAGSDAITFMTSPPALPPTIALSNTQLQFTYTVGSAAPASQSVVVSNSGGGTLTWSATPSASWLTLSSGPGTLTVSINPSGLSPGTYTGSIAIAGVGASNSPQSVTVTLIVSAATTLTPTISLSASQANFAYIAGDAVPASQTISISNSGGGTLSWSANSNASWLSVTPSGTAPSTLTISANPNGLNVGSYSGAITLTATGATNSPQTITVALSITAASQTIAVTSVTNAASSSPGAIAPGEIIAIKGSGLGPATGVSFSVDPSTGMVDTSLAGTMVLFAGIPAPILYASTGQVNAIVPYEIAGRSQVVMQVQYQGVSSTGSTTLLQVASAAPGLFTFNSTGTGPAAAVNQDGSLNGSSNPAAGGSYVTLYFTGGGPTNPAGVTGSISGSVLKWLVQTVTVTIGGQPATVAFDGAAPTFIDGFLQMNISLPSGVHGTVPVVVSIGGIPTPATATLAVQ